MRFLGLLFLLLALPLHAATSPLLLTARHYALYDATSEQMLLEHDAHARIAPGSLTKLMTAYVVFDALRQGKLSPRQSLQPTAYALRLQSEEPRMFLETDKAVRVEELLRGLIVLSANDAARVLAIAVANHEVAFADLMNQQAQRLGLRDSHFANATGMPEANHYSSAHDLALLTHALARDFPEFLPLYKLREYQYNRITQFNRNRLLWLDPYVDGMQTAYSDELGFSLVASAERSGHRLIAVLLGTNKENLRYSESQQLLNHGFQAFEAVRLYQAGQAITRLRLWKGTEHEVALGFLADRYVTVPVGARARLRARLETRQPLIAPVRAGQAAGVLHLLLDGQPYLDLPVVVLDDVALANVFSRGVDAIRLFFE